MTQLRSFLVVAVLLLLSVGAHSQTNISLLGKVGYQSEAKRFGLELGGRYNVTEELRIAPALSFWIPKNHTLGFDVDANVQYAFPISGVGLDVYPLAGLNMSNNRYSYKGVSSSSTDWGFNLGAGLDYHLTKDDFLNFEFKYTFGGWDFATIMLGYGYKF